MAKGNWWITFTDRGPACAGCVTREEAEALASEAGNWTGMEKLPYPANPRLDDNNGWGEGQTPSFCHRPDSCKGRGSCPRNPSCTS